MSANITLKPRQFVMVLSSAAAGGIVGTFLRDELVKLDHIPSATSALATWPNQIPWPLLIINFVGVYLATRLLRGPLRQHDPNNLTRVLVITGFFGGLTSYSGLFVDLASIWHLSVWGSILVALGAIVSGVVGGWLGLVVPRR
ncbi:MAG TPA: CrcB family protein [Acidimicrobiales bacterium]